MFRAAALFLVAAGAVGVYHYPDTIDAHVVSPLREALAGTSGSAAAEGSDAK